MFLSVFSIELFSYLKKKQIDLVVTTIMLDPEISETIAFEVVTAAVVATTIVISEEITIGVAMVI